MRALGARVSAREKLWRAPTDTKWKTESFLYLQCIRIFKTRKDESIWTHLNFCEFSWKFNFWNFFKNFENQNFENFHFSFSIKLRSVVSLRVFKLWQWSNNEKVSILIEEYDFHILLARAHSRARCAPHYAFQQCSFW